MSNASEYRLLAQQHRQNALLFLNMAFNLRSSAQEANREGNYHYALLWANESAAYLASAKRVMKASLTASRNAILGGNPHFHTQR